MESKYWNIPSNSDKNVFSNHIPDIKSLSTSNLIYNCITGYDLDLVNVEFYIN